ncbi:hypothetical protein YERSI8AC_70053 [Enterobacterales bacterium 8AC]|nr:hypothetical protein YERSI8AC_70053 [Enterobacterales bacterium 8AC]
MNSAACQKEAFSLAGRQSQPGTGNAWNLTKPDMRSRIAGGSIAFTDAKKIASGRATNVAEKRISLPFVEGVEGFSDITTRGSEDFNYVTTLGAEGFSHITTRERKEFSAQYARVREAEIIEPIKKGSISNATLWGDVQPDKDFCRMQKSILEQNQSITNSGFLTEIRENKGLAVTTIFSQFGTSRVFSKGQKRSLEQNHQIAAPQVNHAGNIGGITYENFVGQPSGVSLGFLRCSPLSLRPQASSTQAEKLAVGFSGFSRSTLASISSINSCGKRIPFVVERLFLKPVAMLFPLYWCRNTIQVRKENKSVDVYMHLDIWCLCTLILNMVQIAKPGSVGALTGPLTTTDRLIIEAAMKNHTTPLTGRDSLTPNKFTWRFLAISRIDRNAKPCRMSVEAHTEREARRVLAPNFILSFSSRLPVKG